jgi:hypothetical protein
MAGSRKTPRLHQPPGGFREAARNHHREAEKIGLSIGGKEFLEAARVLGPDGLPLEEDLGYFDHAAVKITLTGVPEQAFFAWLHALQQPQSFLGITRLQINPSGTSKTVNCEVEFTQLDARSRRRLSLCRGMR